MTSAVNKTPIVAREVRGKQTFRVLACGHVVPEPIGGRARNATWARCPKCAAPDTTFPTVTVTSKEPPVAEVPGTLWLRPTEYSPACRFPKPVHGKAQFVLSACRCWRKVVGPNTKPARRVRDDLCPLCSAGKVATGAPPRTEAP